MPICLRLARARPYAANYSSNQWETGSANKKTQTALCVEEGETPTLEIQ